MRYTTHTPPPLVGRLLSMLVHGHTGEAVEGSCAVLVDLLQSAASGVLACCVAVILLSVLVDVCRGVAALST